MVYALLLQTNIGHLVSSKTKDLIAKASKEESDNFTAHLEEKVRKLNHIEDCVLQVDLFLELTKILKLRGANYTLAKEIEEQCTLIIALAHEQLLKQDKQFKRFAEGDYNSSKLQQIVKYQMGKLFQQLDKSFHDFTNEDQVKFASQVNDYIQSLPEEKQAKIKEKLGINEVTDKLILKALATSGTSIVFAAIVEISGFAFYATATSLLASFAGVFGVTLPFGVYTGLTSTIAVLANPIFFIPLLLGGGILLVNQQNKSLKKRLLPIIVMQITLPFMSRETDDISYELFINEWKLRLEKYRKLQSDLQYEETNEQKLQSKIQRIKDEISNLHAQIHYEEQQLLMEKQKIYFALKTSNLDELDINDAFLIHRKKYKAIQQELSSLQFNKSNANDSFFKKIRTKITTTLDMKAAEKNLEQLLQKMTENILESTSAFQQAEREKIKACKQKLISLRQTMDGKYNHKYRLESALKQVQQKQYQYRQKLKAMEKQHYGLEHLGANTGQPLLIHEKE